MSQDLFFGLSSIIIRDYLNIWMLEDTMYVCISKFASMYDTEIYKITIMYKTAYFFQ